jgi:DNA-binding Lrp family transcriptional regulator
MRRLKEIDNKIISELLKNSKQSDRALAHRLGVSQPTVSRRRLMLEKTAIDTYTLIPKWDQLGYEILAINFVKIKQEIAAGEKYKAVRERATKWTHETAQHYHDNCITRHGHGCLQHLASQELC